MCFLYVLGFCYWIWYESIWQYTVAVCNIRQSDSSDSLSSYYNYFFYQNECFGAPKMCWFFFFNHKFGRIISKSLRSVFFTLFTVIRVYFTYLESSDNNRWNFFSKEHTKEYNNNRKMYGWTLNEVTPQVNLSNVV